MLSRRIISRQLLDQTVIGLRARSGGWRESACVWAGTRDGAIKQVLFHHQLGNDCGGPLFLELPEHAKFDLYRRLAAENQVLLALLHTHPYEWVGLSPTDQDNQISSRLGFWSIVLPYYARDPWDIESVGCHIRVDGGWQTLHVDQIRQHLIIK